MRSTRVLLLHISPRFFLFPLGVHKVFTVVSVSLTHLELFPALFEFVLVFVLVCADE